MLYFNQAVQRRLVVLTPEPTSLTDGYALIKSLKQNHAVEQFDICINMSSDMKTAREIFKRLHNACDNFLSGISLDIVGIIPRDPEVRKAVVRQTPFSAGNARCPAAKAVLALAETVSEWEIPTSQDGNIKIFWKKFLGLEERVE